MTRLPSLFVSHGAPNLILHNSPAREFLADESPGAFARVVDRLLESPHYGEKWGRHWLDLVHYAESNSFERDNPKPNAWNGTTASPARSSSTRRMASFVSRVLPSKRRPTRSSRSER